MFELIQHLFETDFMPHGHCYYWQKQILIPIVVGDGLTFLSYLIIPFILWKYVRKRKDLKFSFVFKIFAAFILFCGLGHLIDIVNIWEPYYRISAISKMCTGLISIASLIVLIKIFPKALKIPSPAQLEQMNEQIRQKNTELENLNEIYQDVMRTARLGHWELDLNTQYVYWSPVVYDIHEVPPNTEISLEDGIRFYHPDYVEIITKVVQDCIEKGTPWDLELQIITATGKIVWVRAIGKAVYENGKVVKVKGLFQDIDERKAKEQTVIESEADLKEAEAIAKMGHWRWNFHTGEIIWSDEHYRVYGYQPGEVELTKELVASHIVEEDRDRVREVISNAGKTKEEFEVIYRVMAIDGQEKVVMNKGLAYYDEFSNDNIYKGVVRDITSEFRIKQDLEESLLALKRSNQELKDFAYVASHDLQEPLRVIISYLQLLEMSYGDKIDEEGIMYINSTIKASTRMKTLINDLLMLSRLETVEVQEATVNLNEVVANVKEGLKITIQETNTQIIYDKLPTVVGDESRLYQLFQNLISNAIKFRKKDLAPVIEILFRKQENGYEFEIKDNGIGIQSEYQDRIFTIFQRLHTREEYQGTGIGLAICKKIVERHGFNINVESIYGEGCSFIFGLKYK